MTDQDPDGDSNPFIFNLRFPGQYYDAETGLHYNYYRDYDPAIGRYVQPDPIGLFGGLNTYLYANANPLSLSDFLGLAPRDKTYGLPKDFWNWYHRQYKKPGDPDLTKEDAKELFDEWQRQGKPGPDSKGTRRLRGPRGGGLFTPLCIWDITQAYCAENPLDPACFVITPRNPNDICKGDPLCT